MTITETALKLSLSLPQPVDVKFWVFSKRIRVRQPDSATSVTRVCEPLEVFGISLILKDTEYFQHLLSTGFSESARTTNFYSSFPPEEQTYTNDYDYESDSDLDTDSEADNDEDVVAGYSTPAECTDRDVPALTEGIGSKCRQVIIRDTAFLTWRALVYYLYTRKVTFLRLRSEDPAKRRLETKKLLRNLQNPDVAPACSPKSMYRIADKFGLRELRELALVAIGERLLPRIIFREAFSIFTSRYPEVLQYELTYLCDNFYDSTVTEQWPAVLRNMLDTSAVHASEALTTLLSAKLTPMKTRQIVLPTSTSALARKIRAL
ncbi:hypothetical protein BC835DRAFT_777454 [Cytidiella melzeri]|nr:hypothetical protein BC835DRAFT_777454 [Cytidiella melzeri]